MTPIDKSKAQDCALQILRLNRQAIREDIKTAWRRRVVETHPDRNSGNDTEFQLVQAAYQVANGTANEDAIAMMLDLAEPDVAEEASVAAASAPSSPRRARIKTRLIWFNHQTNAQAAKRGEKVETLAIDPEDIQFVDFIESRESSALGDQQCTHRVEKVRQKGRRVSYIIWSSVKPGANEVAVPTGDFRVAGGSKEVALQFASAEAGPATISIPEKLRAAHFPGAQSVRVHFSHGADTRP